MTLALLAAFALGLMASSVVIFVTELRTVRRLMEKMPSYDEFRTRFMDELSNGSPARPRPHRTVQKGEEFGGR